MIMPQPNPRCCARCSQWRPQDRERSYRAACALHGHSPAFDETCPQWQGLPLPPTFNPPPWETYTRGPLGKKVT